MKRFLLCAAVCINFCSFLSASDIQLDSVYGLKRIADLKEVTQETFFELFDKVSKQGQRIRELETELLEGIRATGDEKLISCIPAAFGFFKEGEFSAYVRDNLTLEFLLRCSFFDSNVDFLRLRKECLVAESKIIEYITKLDGIFGEDPKWKFLKNNCLRHMSFNASFPYENKEISFRAFVASKPEGKDILERMSADAFEIAERTLMYLDAHIDFKHLAWEAFKWQCLGQEIPLVSKCRAVDGIIGNKDGTLKENIASYSDLKSKFEDLEATYLVCEELQCQLGLIARKIWGLNWRQQAAEAIEKKDSTADKE